MGYLYIKVIESKKVAVRNSFFVNYPFIRLKIGKEKKNTNFKPGVEWWDKIFIFRQVPKGEHQQLVVQARDKSIHVFGSDWLGEVKIDLDSEDLLDERVHQMWFKFGRGRKAHSRSPRGYIHLAFQYSVDPIVGRPFSAAPVEKVLTFEEWLAANNKNWASDSSAWFPDEPSAEPGWKADQLRQSAPGSYSISPDEPRDRSSSVLSRSPPGRSINPDSSRRHEDRKLSNTRQRSSTLPDVRSPSLTRRQREQSHDNKKVLTNSSESDGESDEEPRLGNLIDLSFDTPQKPQAAPYKSILKNSQSSTKFKDIIDNSQTSSYGKSSSSPPASVEEGIEKIKRLSLSTTPLPAPEGFQVGSEPSFADWYKPNNPFIEMHDNFQPNTSKLT